MSEQLGAPSDLLLNSYLDQPENLKKLILKPEPEFLDSLTLQMNQLDQEQKKVVISNLIAGIGSENKYWNQDKRDGAIEILRHVSLNGDEQNFAQSTYVSALEKVGNGADPYGSLTSLIEAGQIIAQNLEPERFVLNGIDQRMEVLKKWQKITRRLYPEDMQYIQDGIDKIKASFIPATQELIDRSIEEARSLSRPQVEPEEHPDDNEDQEEQMRLGDRDMPDLDTSQAELYNFYMESQKNGQNFKLSLWEKTPEFRQKCKEAGIELERFWNINNPDEASSGLHLLRQNPSSSLKEKFDKAFKNLTGISVDDLDDEKTRILADEIILSASNAKKELLGSVLDFDETVAKLRVVVNEAKATGRPLGKAMKRPIINFLTEYGYEVGENQDIEELIQDESVLEIVKRGFTRKQDLKKAEAEVLDKTFNLTGKDNRFTLSSRREEDLYLGDETGDCTSWHLNTGFNAWTVPVWLSNPGFNFVKVSDGKTLVVKFGVILGQSEFGPELIIDSHEVGKNISDAKIATTQIIDGLKKIKAWALSMGINVVRMVEYSNSRELTPVIKSHLTDHESENELIAVGGIDGVKEFQRNIGSSQVSEKIYLQSAQQDQHADEIDDSDKRRVERIIEQTMNKASEDQKSQIETAIRDLDWEKLNGLILNVKYPLACEVFTNPFDYAFPNNDDSYSRYDNLRRNGPTYNYNYYDEGYERDYSYLDMEEDVKPINLPLKTLLDKAYYHVQHPELVLKFSKKSKEFQIHNKLKKLLKGKSDSPEFKELLTGEVVGMNLYLWNSSGNEQTILESLYQNVVVNDKLSLDGRLPILSV